jgi:choline-sulfatase
MTGKYVHQIGTWWNRVPLDPAEMTWARKLDQHGVETTLLGKIDAPGEHESPGFTRYKLSMRRRAFDPYPLTEPLKTWRAGETRPSSRGHLEHSGGFDPETTEATENGYNPKHGLYYQDRQVRDWTLEYLFQKGAGDSHRPWVLHVGFEYPHWPYVCPERYFRLYYPDKVQMPHAAVFPRNEALPAALRDWQRWNDFGEIPDDVLRRVLASYYGMVTCMDEMIGEIVSELKTQGLFDNTIIM